MIGIGEIAKELIAPVTALISKAIPDKDQAARLAFEISTMAATQAHQVAIAQLEINKEEAKHGSMFVAGARPAAIWVCVIALFQMLVLFPLISYVYSIWGQEIPIPQQDTATMFGVLGPLLGLGAYRTIEKVRDVNRDSLGSGK